MRLHLFVSPHFDDAVLSCGATMHRLRRLGERVMVLTVCAGVPDNSQSLATHARNIVGQQVTPEYTTALRHTELHFPGRP